MNNNIQYYYHIIQGMAVIFDEFEKLVVYTTQDHLPDLRLQFKNLKEWTREQEKEYGVYEFSIKRQVAHRQMSL